MNALRLARFAEPRRRAQRVGSTAAHACDFYRQGIHWFLLSEKLTTGRLTDGAGNASEAEPPPGRDVEGLELSFQALSALPDQARQALLLDLRASAEQLRRRSEAARAEIDRVWHERLFRPGGALVVLLLLAALAVFQAARAREGRELLRQARWEASSVGEGLGCQSPAQQCETSPEFFVHTQDEAEPWVRFDLGTPRTFSELEVRNRADCCTERAVPLIFEVSDNQQSWREVLRREDDFSLWKASFPKVTARFVRLRVGRTTNLHLKAVRLFP
ncbi:MAG TPA: discoidin domain-containing protein [Polyangiaceae bacterium]|nr:discoidin domain-containing protein [Polyangiaceae bacterium]